MWFVGDPIPGAELGVHFLHPILGSLITFLQGRRATQADSSLPVSYAASHKHLTPH